MTTPDTILMEIRSRAAILKIEAIIAGRPLGPDEAEREAARQVADEQRKERSLTAPAPLMPGKGEPGLELFRRLQQVAFCMAASGYRPDAQSSLAERFAWFLFGSEEQSTRTAAGLGSETTQLPSASDVGTVG